MIKNIKDLKRFDFTSDCKTCVYRKDLGVLEYCCGFVYDMLQEKRLMDLKKHILEYILVDDSLDNVNPVNVIFQDETKYGVTLTFKTNLIEEKQVILNEIHKALSKSPYFSSVGFDVDSLYKEEQGKPRKYLLE